jgi:predicted permease
MAGEATASLSELSGIRPQLGRWFLPGEVGPDATMVAVLGDEVWRNEFGSDPEVIGRTITLDHDLYTVIGVMPPEFRFENGLFQGSRGLLSSRETGERPVWVPLGHSYGARGGPDWYYDREGWSFEAIARLRPGVTLEAAHADVEAALAGLDPIGPMRVKLAYREDLNVAGLPSQVLLLAVPSLLLLLIACGNVATLLLGEGLNRQAEIATRAALGAGVRRIVRLLLTESLLLGALGSLAGAAVAFGATRLLVVVAPAGSAAHSLQVNPTVLSFACVTGVVAGLLFGLFPALTMGWWSKGDVTSRLRGRALSRSRRAVSAVVGLEVALTVVLLVAGGLFTRTVWNLFAVDNGFDPENLIALRTANDNSPRAERPRINQDIVERLEAIPGVVAATGSWAVPNVMGLWPADLEIEGQTTEGGETLPRVRYDIVLHNYHEVLGIPLLEGRYFARTDGLGGVGAALVSESTARRFWQDRSPIGERIKLSRDTVWSTVVGVVGDMKCQGPGEAASAPVYIPYVQNPNRNGMRFAFTVRTGVDPGDIIPQLAAAAREIEPNLLIKEALLLETEIARTATDQRYRALMVVIFGTFAVVLAAVGIFGVVARSLAQRTREMAIRVALGAEPTRLGQLVLRGSLYAAGVGVVVGLIGAFWASRLLSRFLFGVQSWDPATYGSVVLLVAAVCLTASYLPARRVLGIQPAEVLKGD